MTKYLHIAAVRAALREGKQVALVIRPTAVPMAPLSQCVRPKLAKFYGVRI